MSFFHAGGGQYQGLYLEPPAQLRAGSWGRGFFKDLPCAASDFGGFSSPDLTHPGSDSNLRQHFVLISFRGGEAASGGPSGTVGGPLLGTVMSSPPFYQGPWRASQIETAAF